MTKKNTASKKRRTKTATRKKAKPKTKAAPKPRKETGANKVIADVVSEIAGPDVVPLVKALRKKPNASEFKLADAIDEEINTVRNMLYRLYDANLVSFIRKKDKKKGWYIYYWTFNQKRVKDLLRNIRQNKAEKLRERLAREKSTSFFTCPNKCIRLDFEQAIEFEYKCPECGELLEQEDNALRIAELTKELAKLEKEIKAS